MSLYSEFLTVKMNKIKMSAKFHRDTLSFYDFIQNFVFTTTQIKHSCENSTKCLISNSKMIPAGHKIPKNVKSDLFDTSFHLI